MKGYRDSVVEFGGAAVPIMRREFGSDLLNNLYLEQEWFTHLELEVLIRS